MAKEDVLELKGGFDKLESKELTKPKRGRKPLVGEDKTEQQGIRTKQSVWRKFKILVKIIETEALEKGEKEPTQGDVFEKAVELLYKKYK